MKKFFQPSKKLFGFIMLIFSIVVLLIGSTYAYQQLSATSNTAQGQGGCFQVSYTGQNLDAGSIVSTDNYLNGAHTTVTLSKDSSCKIYTEANIYLHTNNETTAPVDIIEAMRYKLVTNDGYERNGFITTKGDTLLGSVALTDTSTTYTIYVWIDSNLSAGAYHETSYSGYIYADSNQTSTIDKDTAPPILFLKKESYIDGFDDWELATGHTVQNNILTMSQSGISNSSYYVNGEYWYLTFDFYTETASTAYTPKGGIYFSSTYYDDNNNATTSIGNYYTNGFSNEASLNTWTAFTWRNNWNNRYGPNVKEVLLSFNADTQYGQPPIKIRNFQIHGQVYSSFYDIYVNSSDNVGITTTKYASGRHDVSYFTSNGTNVTNNKVTVTENGTYTFYVSDADGNSSVTTVEITNIDYIE